MACVSSVTFSYQVNGHRFGYLVPSRGLRQGDLLSPYLFMFVAEGFSHIFKTSAISGMKASCHGPSISHLLYVDDSILFSQASMEQAGNIKTTLDVYSGASG